MLKNRFAVIFIMCVFLAPSSFGATGATSSAQLRHRTGPALDGGVYGTYGTMGNSDGTIPSRKMDSGSVFIKPGFHFGVFRLAGYGEYRFVGQIDSPSGVSNQNLSGSGYNLGLLGALDFNRIKIEGGYQLYGTYTLSQQTAAAQSSNYSNSKGYFFLLGFQLSHHWDIFGIYSSVQFNQLNLSGQGGTDITSNPLTFNSYGLGLTYYFF